MIKGVATWRCKCGHRVKVITETDRSRIADVDRLPAACPNCGDKQIIYAHRILSVKTEDSQESATDPKTPDEN
jgi:hypothetical protein